MRSTSASHLVAAGALLAVCVASALPGSQAAAAVAGAPLSASSFVETWSVGPLADKGGPIAESSPILATLDNAGPAVVVGDRSGYLYAYHLSDGSAVPGWPVFDGGAPIDSAPSVAAVNGEALDSVFVGTGNAQDPGVGGYEAYSPSGQVLWRTTVDDPPSDPHPVYAVQASLTVADLQGSTDVFAGSLDQLSYAMNASDGSVLPGWPFFSADSVFSTAAVGDLYGTGQEYLVDGGASTAGLAMGQAFPRGGQLRVISPEGGLVCDYNPNQEVDSSPAIGDFLAGGAPGIVVGTGSFYEGASDTDTVKAFNPRCGLVWSTALDGSTGSSPALADVYGNGQLDVVEGTDYAGGGSVWVLDGATGAPIWHEAVVGSVVGPVVTADLTGAGYQDLLVPTVHGVEVLDGENGAEIAVLGKDYGFQNAPLVTEDPNGSIGITIAGYNGDNQGVIVHYEIPGSNGALAVGPGSWPMFHHDPQLSGAASVLPDLGRVTPTDLVAQAGDGTVSLSWDVPPSEGGSAVTGYNVYMGTAPGHEAAAPLNGSTPITATSYVATGLTNGTTYYFEVTAVSSAGEGAPSNEASAMPTGPPSAPNGLVAVAGDGQVSLTWAKPSSDGGTALKGYVVYESSAPGTVGQPVATLQGTSYVVTGLTNGTTYYFEVSAFNAAGSSPMPAQVAATPEPPTSTTPPPPPPVPAGYWLAEASGQVAAFGHVSPYRGGRPGSPVVAIAPTTDHRGYWLATRDGGVFAFGDAGFFGSMGGEHLSSPVVGMAATPGGKGYWLVAADGGVFAFGDAGFFGSMGGEHLSSPVVGMAATPGGKGYWLVAADGGVFALGDAPYFGSLSAKTSHVDVVGIAG
ncbi:MAG: fibronectin type III domain-containing protein [Acidimicrobiales bacterium]